MQVEVCSKWRALRDRWANFASLEPIVRQQWWFRGHGNAEWELKPTLDRKFSFTSDEDRNSCVQALLREFKRELPHVGAESIVGLEGVALQLYARHQGLPSPIMDWTESPYIASFFAFEDAIRCGSSTACIWAFNRSKFESSRRTVELLNEFRMVQFNKRALHQRGVFLRVATVSDSVPNLLGDALLKIEIPSSRAKTALVDLGMMTINATYLFNDAEAGARTAALRVALERNN